MKTMRLDNNQKVSSKERLCLPYGISVLEMARWFRVSICNPADRQFKLIAGDDAQYWRGSNVIELYAHIQRHCLGYSLAESSVVDIDTDSILILDKYQRFSIFSAIEDVTSEIYPFTREEMWEHFSLVQEIDDDQSLAQIFSEIHTKQ
jgi:hypothetical protein